MLRLGIMTHQIKNLERFSPYVTVGKEEGFKEVLVYTPEGVNILEQRIHGFIYSQGKWAKTSRSFPDISIDIGYYTDPRQIHTVKRVKQHSLLPFVGYGLGNKWTIQKHLMTSSQIKPFLLPTEWVKTSQTILSFIHDHGSVMIKPLNGKGGKGIFRLTRGNDHFILENTLTGSSTRLTLPQVSRTLSTLLTTNKYLVQKWIDIRDREGHVYDIRALVQKNKYGEWQLTGMGVRQAAGEKITSNLTGGGNAHPVFPFLRKQFGEEKSQSLINQLEALARNIPVHLENSYRKRLVELGLDLAVDRSGAVWIIEVNIKPGRTIWRKIGNLQADDASLRAPIQYARYLVESKTRKK